MNSKIKSLKRKIKQYERAIQKRQKNIIHFKIIIDDCKKELKELKK